MKLSVSRFERDTLKPYRGQGLQASSVSAMLARRSPSRASVSFQPVD